MIKSRHSLALVHEFEESLEIRIFHLQPHVSVHILHKRYFLTHNILDFLQSHVLQSIR
jgi:hypothetical protein